MALERVVLTVLTRAALALLMLLRKRDEKREGGAGGVAGVATDDGGGAAKISFGGYSTERVYAMLRHGRGRRPLVGRFSDCEKSSRGGGPALFARDSHRTSHSRTRNVVWIKYIAFFEVDTHDSARMCCSSLCSLHQ